MIHSEELEMYAFKTNFQHHLIYVKLNITKVDIIQIGLIQLTAQS